MGGLDLASVTNSAIVFGANAGLATKTIGEDAIIETNFVI
jgi:hypothetical protein